MQYLGMSQNIVSIIRYCAACCYWKSDLSPNSQYPSCLCYPEIGPILSIRGVGRILRKGGGWREARGAKCQRHYGQRSGGCRGSARGLWPHVLGMIGSTFFLFWFLFSLSSFFLSYLPLSDLPLFFFGGGGLQPPQPHPCQCYVEVFPNFWEAVYV